MAWPKYQQLPVQRVSLAHLRAFFSNRASIKAVRTAGVVLLLIVIYLMGTHFSPPFFNLQTMHEMLEHSMLLSAIDALFTGYALGNLAPFALGVFPFIFFYGAPTKLVGSHLRKGLRPGFKASFAFIVFVVVVVAWLTFAGVVPATIIGFIATTLYLVFGTILLLIVESQLTAHNGPDIISLNAVIICVNYVRTLVLVHHSFDLVVGAVIVLFIVSFALLIRQVKAIPLVNIKQEKVKKGELPLPASNSLMRFSLLICTFLLLALTATLLNLFANLDLTPFGSSLPNVLLFIAVLALLAMFFANNELIDGLSSQFNGKSTARMLMTNYWIIPGRAVGEATAKFLTHEALKRHRLNYVFYLSWAILFSLVGLFAQYVNFPITSLPFGPLGFIIILTLCSEVGNELVYIVRHFIQSVNFGDFWSPPTSAIHNLQALAEPYDIDEFVQRFLSGATAEEQDQITQILHSFKAGNIRPADIYTILKVLSQINKRHVEQAVELTLVDILLKSVVCLILSSLVTILAVWLIKATASITHFDLNSKDLALFAIPIWIGALLTIAVIFDIHQNIKAMMRNPGSVALFHASRRSQEDQEEAFDVDKEAAAYNFMLARQREVIDNDLRRAILARTNLHEHILDIILAEVGKLVDAHFPGDAPVSEEQVKQLLDAADIWVNIPELSATKLMHATTLDEIKGELGSLIVQHYETQGQQIEVQMNALNTSSTSEMRFSLLELESSCSRRVIERLWQQYLDSLNAMRVQLFSRSYMRSSALAEFEQQADNKFAELQQNIQHTIVDSLLKLLRYNFTLTMTPRGRSRTPPTTIKGVTHEDEAMKALEKSSNTLLVDTPLNSTEQEREQH